MKHRRWVAVVLAVTVAVPLTACTATASKAPYNVAVLVVDDFTSTSTRSGRTPLTSSPSGTCTLGTNEVNTNGAGEGDLNNNTHGAAVYRVLQQRLNGILGNPASQSDPVARPGSSTEWKVPGKTRDATLRLIAVNSTGWTTDSAIGATTAAMKDLPDTFSRIVMNLSFVTIPCDPTGLFADQGAGLLAWYNTVIADKDYADVKDDLVNVHRVQLDKDSKLPPDSLKTINPYVLSDPRLIPLRDCLVNKVYDQVNQELASENKTGPMVQSLKDGDSGWNSNATQALVKIPAGRVVVPVGAAGNGVACAAVKDPRDPKQPLHMSPPFPFAPALWDFVVSASARNTSSMPNKAGYANGGELVLDDSHPDIAPHSYGTSYSAPRLSAVEALYLADPGKVNCDGDEPTLGYITAATDNLPASGPAPWKNEPWERWANYCGDFDPHQAAGTP